MYSISVKNYIGYKYDYSEYIYINNKVKGKIICKDHGVFEQTMNMHLRGRDCPRCSKFTSKYDQESFLARSKELHGSAYNYSKVVYVHKETPVIIICPIHGEYLQKPSGHLKGSGCHSCGITLSKEENAFRAYFEDKGYTTEKSYRPKWLNRKELDIYIPELNLAIEYNGFLFHHSTEDIGYKTKPIDYHLIKYNTCLENNIKLLHIYDFENLSLWYEKLDMYLENPDNFDITYENIPRLVPYRKKQVTVYGISDIVTSPLI